MENFKQNFKNNINIQKKFLIYYEIIARTEFEPFQNRFVFKKKINTRILAFKTLKNKKKQHVKLNI